MYSKVIARDARSRTHFADTILCRAIFLSKIVVVLLFIALEEIRTPLGAWPGDDATGEAPATRWNLPDSGRVMIDPSHLQRGQGTYRKVVLQLV